MSKLHDELWKYCVCSEGEPIPEEPRKYVHREDFSTAIDEAMERQRKACAEAAKLYTYGYGDRIAEKMLAAVLNAKVEEDE